MTDEAHDSAVETPAASSPPSTIDAVAAPAIYDPAQEGGPLAHIPLFSRLEKAEQQALFAAMRVEKIEAHQTIFWLGERGDSFYLVSRGRVAVTVPNDRGEHVVISHLGAGGFFGEISLLDGGSRTATVRATQETELFVLPRTRFQEFLRSRPEVAIDILTVMGQRQRASTEALRVMKNPNIAFEQSRLGLWQRTSDIIASTAASHYFTLFHIFWFGLWIGLNLLAMFGPLPERFAFDPFPFGLLTMVVSLEAIFLSIFVMVSQNRQAEKDRLRIDLDYQVNLKAQTEIMAIGPRLDRLEELLKPAGAATPASSPPPASAPAAAAPAKSPPPMQY